MHNNGNLLHFIYYKFKLEAAERAKILAKRYIECLESSWMVVAGWQQQDGSYVLVPKIIKLWSRHNRFKFQSLVLNPAVLSSCDKINGLKLLCFSAREFLTPKYFLDDLLKMTAPGALYRESWPSLFIGERPSVSDPHALLCGSRSKTSVADPDPH